MHRSNRLAVLCLAVGFAACAQRSLGPTRFPLSYQPQLDSADVVVPQRCATLSGVRVDNGLRGDGVGQRTLESSPLPPQSIRASGDIAAWARAAAGEMVKRAGLSTQDPAGPLLTLKLDDIRIEENVHVNSGYSARVVLDARLADARGRECWSQRHWGDAKNYGSAGEAVNYNETVNHAMDRAVMAVLADRGFQDAACGPCRR